MLQLQAADAVRTFLASDRLAFVGVSRDESHFNTSVYRAFRDRGYEMLPVHPQAETILGDRCYRTVADLPPGTDGLVVMAHPEDVPELVRAANGAGIRKIWLHRGVGRGAVSPEALAVCEELGVTAVEGACPLMYLEPVTGIHRFHRFLARGRLPAA